MREDSALDRLAIDTIRTLSMDAVQKARSGHPGTPMALAPVVYQLWQRHLVYDPEAPLWPNRDRFVLSVGHASMLIYSMLHLASVKAVDEAGRTLPEPAVSLDDIRRFRQLDSKTPGHPEYRITTGVETTTGPLGQGLGNSVGMAIAGRWYGARFNRDDLALFDYRVYALCGDGDLMEGVSHEAASLAGHLGLGNLTWIYDSNRVTIEGHTDLAYSDDVEARFRGYGWHTLHVDDANDMAALDAALDDAKARTDAPTLIVVKSIIGWGAPNKQDTAAAHGEALGEDEVVLAKRAYGWPEDKTFYVPAQVPGRFAEGVGARGARARQAWEQRREAYARRYPEFARELAQIEAQTLPDGWDADIPRFAPDAKGDATRSTAGEVLNAIAARVPWLIGGAADLAPSTKTLLKFEGAGSIARDNPGGRNLHFGVREHAMGAVANGLALSNLRPFAATFLIFSDYMKPPIRLAAIMEVPVVFVFTHDSIGLGEDGPTHQPVEQLASLRGIPGLTVLRPADANEVAEAWRVALSDPRRPAALVLSRQPLPTLDRSRYASAEGLRRGAYVLADPPGGEAPQVLLLATGSEVPVCIDAYERLTREGIAARVISMPSWDIFERQDDAYKDHVLPPEVEARVAVEQAATIGWDRYVGRTGAKIVMHTFGASAPMRDLQNKFGFTPECVYEAAKQQIARTVASKGLPTGD
ncbi:transketolase [Trinickia caryophylli]|uniref:Transketolase n=1 Tax=Trinickia caryophylli TaxID=28094 RepID=A0A1X7EBM0_TRICW|nr:transketolase [Trinickia caryophylli]PMS12939.1 transketolase [Trinickia caryophylli]TRX14700.1 transketolase [Trinickia caryophylli]WQE14543.1 transketolase [Trinickia caryophylli]SMF31132.1 transketolase [Trinickia caryophylli]GLU32049.1 transketolase [Trinickia caryophylli]